MGRKERPLSPPTWIWKYERLLQKRVDRALKAVECVDTVSADNIKAMNPVQQTYSRIAQNCRLYHKYGVSTFYSSIEGSM